MANEFYITAGLPAQDNDDARTANAFYITAGLAANDYTPTGGGGTSDSDSIRRRVQHLRRHFYHDEDKE